MEREAGQRRPGGVVLHLLLAFLVLGDRLLPDERLQGALGGGGTRQRLVAAYAVVFIASDLVVVNGYRDVERTKTTAAF